MINLYAANFYNSSYPTVVSFVQKEDENSVLLFSGNQFRKSTPIIEGDLVQNVKFGRGFFGDIRNAGIINFTINSIDDDYIYTLIFNDQDSNYHLKPLIFKENISDYIYMNLKQKSYLVYSNKTGELSISLLKK
jgi:hypothetical protein